MIENQQKNLYSCPSDRCVSQAQAFETEDDYIDHLLKCRQLQNQTVFACKYHLGHMFLTKHQKEIHEAKCKSQTSHPFLVDFKSADNSILISQKNSLFLKQKKWYKDIHNQNYKENIEEKQLKVKRPRPVLQNPNIESVKNEQSNISNFTLQYENTSYSLLFLNQGQNTLKQTSIQIEKFASTQNYSFFTSQSFTESHFKQWMVGEFIFTYGDEESFMSKLQENSETIAINQQFIESNNEVLFICAQSNKYFGEFIIQGQIGVFVIQAHVFNSQSEPSIIYDTFWITQTDNFLENYQSSININHQKSQDQSFFTIKKQELLEEIESYEQQIQTYQADMKQKIYILEEQQIQGLFLIVNIFIVFCINYLYDASFQLVDIKNQIKFIENQQLKKNMTMEKQKMEEFLKEKQNQFGMNEKMDRGVLKILSEKQEELKEIFQREKSKFLEQVEGLRSKLKNVQLENKEKIQQIEQLQQQKKNLEATHDKETNEYQELNQKVLRVQKQIDELGMLNRQNKDKEDKDQLNQYQFCPKCQQQKKTVIYFPCKHIYSICMDCEKKQCLFIKCKTKSHKIIKWNNNE